MIRWQLASSLAAVLLSLALCLRQKQPLFFKILFYGLISYCFGTLFSFCYTFVYKAPPAGFHIGYLGQTGMYFFLLSSYYGAIDRLADGGERQYRGYRLLALAAPLVFLLFLLSLLHQGELNSSFALLAALPLLFPLYFSLKHILLPDVELGIIRVMRPYNFCVLLFCFSEAASFGIPSDNLAAILSIGRGLLLFLLPVLAERGVRQWYI